jgi:hypothetical protein
MYRRFDVVSLWSAGNNSGPTEQKKLERRVQETQNHPFDLPPTQKCLLHIMLQNYFRTELSHFTSSVRVLLQLWHHWRHYKWCPSHHRVIRTSRPTDMDSSCVHTERAVADNREVLTLFLARRFLSPRSCRRYVPPERRLLQEPHGVTSQKTAFFIVIAVKTLKSYKNDDK